MIHKVRDLNREQISTRLEQLGLHLCHAVRDSLRGALQQAQYHATRLRPDYIPALVERYPTNKIPSFFERRLDTIAAQQFTESLLTPTQRVRLETALATLSDGMYVMDEPAGTHEDGNRHIHRFVIKKSGTTCEMFYIDPEHSMGKSINRNRLRLPRIGDLRPKVNVLYAAKLKLGEPIMSVAALRYRAAVIDKDHQELNKPAAQFKIAEDMLTTGKLPDILHGQENEITFWLNLRMQEGDYEVSIQARAANNERDIQEMIAKMLRGEALPTHNPLEGQMRRFRAIMRTYFPRYLEENKFHRKDTH